VAGGSPAGGEYSAFRQNAGAAAPALRDLLAFLRSAAWPVDLASVAYTLQVGREAIEKRLGFVVGSIEQLTSRLSAWLDGEQNLDGVHDGRVDPGREGMSLIGRDEDMQDTIGKWIARRKLASLLDLWVRGLSFDWNRLYDGEKPRRVSLPAYPFAKQRCWIPETAPVYAPEPLDMNVDMDVDAKAIEDIINQLDDDMIETTHAIEALKMLV
jgi:polyketide synthase PksN